MAEKKKDSSGSAGAFKAESQQERWVKYGANVALTIVVMLLLAGAVVYIAQRVNLRKDMTAGGVYSLKPQTVRLVRDLPQKVKLVGLFSRSERQSSELRVRDEDTAEVRYQQVADLLQEYQQESNGKIAYDMIDPDTQPGKVDQLFNEVMEKYGNDVKVYKEVLEAYKKAVDEIDGLAKKDLGAFAKLPRYEDRQMQVSVSQVAAALEDIPQWLKDLSLAIEEQMQLKVPDYKTAAERVKSRLGTMSETCAAVLKRYTTLEGDAKTPNELKELIKTSRPNIEQIKKLADDVLKKSEGLGSIKQLDELRQNKSNSIAVMGETDMKVIPLESIYVTQNVRVMDAEGAKPRFAGEQQVSTALVTLTGKEKKKVAFVRSGGPPVAARLRMMNYEGYLSDVADRLREYNVEVLEKDLSGQWAMQAMQFQMQGMPLPPEPTDEQLKDAVWIAMVAPLDPRQMMQNPSAGQMGAKVAEHLRSGGSAMILVDPQAERMDFLKEWGVEPQPQFLAVHEKVEASGARSGDRVEDWHRQQPVFVLDQYGDHLITKPLQSLDGLFVPLIPVNTVDAKGVKTTKILPVPNTPTSWGESDFDSVRQAKPVEYNPGTADKPGDLAQPLWGGAVAEKEDGKGRLVVIGCRFFAANDYVQEPDLEMLRTQRRLVPRFPGNPELFVNSVFWLAKMDTMIAISPSALEVSRVAPMSSGARAMWKTVLIGLLPAGVLMTGMMVYLKRRD